jgi:protocatechuate 3,4-dioxygenase beta subunit
VNIRGEFTARLDWRELNRQERPMGRVMPRFGFALSILVLHFTFHSIQAQPGETKTGTATISGRVTLKGEPARGVMVILLTEISWSATAPRARADENGRFSFTSVAAGSYSIFAVAPGYVSPKETRFGLLTGTLSIAEGEKVEDVDLEIKRGGVIAGRIKDSQGRPVIEERISLHQLDRDNTPQPNFSYNPNFNMSLTDDRGVYRIYGLPEGRYLVSVGYASSERITSSRAFYPRVFYPNASSESGAKVIEVSEGSEATDVDITVSDPKETRDVSGRVVDADTGQPVEGVRIEVRGVSSDGGHESESGPNGEFRVFGLLPGKYALLTPSRWNSGFVGGPVIFDVSEGGATGIELKVRRGTASISGLVVIEGTNDPKVLAKLSQVYLYADINLAAPKMGAGVEMPPVQVNADGSFRMDGLPAGKAGIARWSQRDDLTIARIEHNGAPARERIEIAAGEQVTGVRVVFLYGALTLRGEMKVVGGTLPADCRFSIYALRADQNAEYSQSAWTDDRGQFVIENLAPGEYEIRVMPHHPDPEIRKRFPSVKKRLFVGSDNQQPVTLVVDLSRKEEDK